MPEDAFWMSPTPTPNPYLGAAQGTDGVWRDRRGNIIPLSVANKLTAQDVGQPYAKPTLGQRLFAPNVARTQAEGNDQFYRSPLLADNANSIQRQQKLSDIATLPPSNNPYLGAFGTPKATPTTSVGPSLGSSGVYGDIADKAVQSPVVDYNSFTSGAPTQTNIDNNALKNQESQAWVTSSLHPELAPSNSVTQQTDQGQLSSGALDSITKLGLQQTQDRIAADTQKAQNDAEEARKMAELGVPKSNAVLRSTENDAQTTNYGNLGQQYRNTAMNMPTINETANLNYGTGLNNAQVNSAVSKRNAADSNMLAGTQGLENVGSNFKSQYQFLPNKDSAITYQVTPGGVTAQPTKMEQMMNEAGMNKGAVAGPSGNSYVKGATPIRPVMGSDFSSGGSSVPTVADVIRPQQQVNVPTSGNSVVPESTPLTTGQRLLRNIAPAQQQVRQPIPQRPGAIESMKKLKQEQQARIQELTKILQYPVTNRGVHLPSDQLQNMADELDRLLGEK